MTRRLSRDWAQTLQGRRRAWLAGPRNPKEGWCPCPPATRGHHRPLLGGKQVFGFGKGCAMQGESVTFPVCYTLARWAWWGGCAFRPHRSASRPPPPPPGTTGQVGDPAAHTVKAL